MNDRRVKTLPVLVGMLLAVSVVSAQQPASATYDRERKVSLQGPVTRIEWVNPNAFVFINVRDAAGRDDQLGSRSRQPARSRTGRLEAQRAENRRRAWPWKGFRREDRSGRLSPRQ